jgi:hypothetical protein
MKIVLIILILSLTGIGCKEASKKTGRELLTGPELLHSNMNQQLLLLDFSLSIYEV